MSEETQTTVEEIVEMGETPATIDEETVPESVPAAEELVPEPETLPEPKRKPGRPAGSKNKEPAKPRAKKKVPVVVSEVVDIAPSQPPTTPTETPRWDAQHRPIPTEAKTEIAELMLRLLSQQSNERIRRKDNLRRSWFA